jgi:hypothetical protein
VKHSVLFLLVLGCASQRLAPGTAPQLLPNEGLLVMGASEGVQLHVLRLNASPDWAEEVIVPPLGPKEIAVMAVPANKYCITEIQTAHVEYYPVDPSGSLWCIDVRANAWTYGGHVVVEELQAIRVERSPAAACEALKADFTAALRAVSTEASELASCTP